MSLKDELLKAKLISKEQIKRLEHEERVERSKLGKEGIQEKKRHESKDIEEKQRQKKVSDQELAKQENVKREEKEKNKRVDEIIQQGALREGVYGNRRFYFVARNGKIPFLLLSEGMVEKLEHGGAAIVESDKEHGSEFVTVNAGTALQLQNLQPDLVRFFQAQ